MQSNVNKFQINGMIREQNEGDVDIILNFMDSWIHYELPHSTERSADLH